MSDAAYYALEKLIQAVDTLVAGAGRIQERLQAAGINLLPARPQDIPYDDLRHKLVGIKDDLSFEPSKAGEGSIAATMQITNDEDASAIARRILDLYSELNDRLKRDKSTC
jgi:hypothetical protein